MHFLGIHANGRRLYSPTFYSFLSGVQPLNVFISLSAFLLGAAQVRFIVNFFWSLTRGAPAADNPRRVNTLEWMTASPPPHGNWGETPPPVVYRWPYDYRIPEAADDYLPPQSPIGITQPDREGRPSAPLTLQPESGAKMIKF